MNTDDMARRTLRLPNTARALIIVKVLISFSDK